MDIRFDAAASVSAREPSAIQTTHSFDIARNPQPRPGEPFDRQPFGNLGHIFQVRNAAGDYELYFESRIGETGLVWTNRGRPIDMRGDYRFTVDFPIPRQRGTPFAERLNEVARELDGRARAAMADPDRPRSENPFVRFGNAVVGAGASLIGDPISALAGVAPYFAVTPGLFQDPSAMGVARDLSRTASGAVDARLRDWLRAAGIGVDTAEFDFGVNAFRVASALAGIYTLGEGGLRLIRVNNELRIAGQNLHVLASFENLSRGKIGQVARYLDTLTPQDIAAFDPALLRAMRDGLARHPGYATARAALARLDDLTRGRIVVTSQPGGGAGGAGARGAGPQPTQPRLSPGRGEAIDFGAPRHPVPSPGGGVGESARSRPAPASRATPPPDTAPRIDEHARRIAEADRARSAALRDAADRHPITHSPDVSIARPYENWGAAANIARDHNAGAALTDIAVPLPFARQLGGDAILREIAMIRGDAIAIGLELRGLMQAGSVPGDFDLAANAAHVGIDWEAARRAAAQARVPGIAARNPLTIAGHATFAMPDAARAEREALAHNAEARDTAMVALPLRIMRHVADGLGGEIPAQSHEIWLGRTERARAAIAALQAQGRLAPGEDFAGIIARAGLSGSFAAREQAGLDMRAAQIEAQHPTTFDGTRIAIQPSREAAIREVLAHNGEAHGEGERLWLYLQLENRISGEGLAPDARGRVHAIYAHDDFAMLAAFHEAMQAQGRLPAEVTFESLLREAGIAGRHAAWRERVQTGEAEADHAPSDRESSALTLPGRSDIVAPSAPVALDDAGAIIDFVRDRRLESWEGDGLDDIDPDALDEAAATLYALDFSSPGGIGFFDDDLRAAMEAIRRAGGRAFPDPVAPGEPGSEAMPRASDYGLPDRGYVYVGMDDAGHPVWRGEDGRHVGPFAREPAGDFANAGPERRPQQPRFPFNPTAPGPLAPLAPPGALAGYDPGMTEPASREDLSPQSRDMLDTLIGMIRDAGFDLRGGLNVSIRDPLAGLQVLRSTGAVGLDTLRALNARRGDIMQAAAAGDVRTLLDIFAHALGVGARIGEGLHEPQLVRLALQELIGLRGLGINSALQWKAQTLEGYAERSFIGDASPFRFTPDPETLTVDQENPGFAEVRGRIALDATPLSEEEAAGAVDIFGNAGGAMLRLNADLRIGKTMFEFYTPSFEIGPFAMPGAEYREELASEIIIPAGSILPREFVSVIDRAVGDGRFAMRFQTDYRDDPEGQAQLHDELAAALSGTQPLAGQPGFLADFGQQNVEATHRPGFRARLSAPPGRIPGGRDTIDANFLPSEHFVNWIVALVSGGAVHLPMDRAVPGEFDVAARFAPDALHGYADKVRIKLNLGPSTSLGDVIGLRTAFYLVRESRPDARTALMRSQETATVTFEDSFAQERAIDVPIWLSMMLGQRVAPGQVEAALGLQPLPPGGIVIPPGGSESVRDLLQRAWHAAGPEERDRVAGFIADHLAGPAPDFVDGHTLTPQLKDALIETLYRIATPVQEGALSREAAE